MQIIESTNLIPMDGDVAKITRRAEEFKDLHESLQRNLPTYLTLAMDALAGVHQNVKATMLADASRQMVIHLYVAGLNIPLANGCLDACRRQEKIKVPHDFCRHPEISDVTRRILLSRKTRRGNFSIAY
jgi:hypothetical protein